MRSVVLKIISKVSYFFSAYSLAIQVKALEREKKRRFCSNVYHYLYFVFALHWMGKKIISFSKYFHTEGQLNL